jgi:hypothetical protein
MHVRKALKTLQSLWVCFLYRSASIQGGRQGAGGRGGGGGRDRGRGKGGRRDAKLFRPGGLFVGGSGGRGIRSRQFAEFYLDFTEERVILPPDELANYYLSFSLLQHCISLPLCFLAVSLSHLRLSCISLPLSFFTV